jgi:hypothetical protein
MAMVGLKSEWRFLSAGAGSSGVAYGQSGGLTEPELGAMTINRPFSVDSRSLKPQRVRLT